MLSVIVVSDLTVFHELRTHTLSAATLLASFYISLWAYGLQAEKNCQKILNPTFNMHKGGGGAGQLSILLTSSLSAA